MADALNPAGVHPPIDARAAVKHGLFARRQALEAGYSSAAIDRKVRKGEWLRLERGLLRAATRESRPGDDVLKAVLRAGPSAVASHRSAAAVLGWDLLQPPRKIEIVVPRTNGKARSEAALIRHAALAADEVQVVGILPVTSSARTAVDLAASAEHAEAVVTIDSALRLRALTLRELAAALASRRTHPQHRKVAEVFAALDGASGSAPESVARLLFAEAGLARPVCQFEVRVGGRFVARVDFAWPDQYLVVEIDGFQWHSGREPFQKDRTRQNALVLAGYRVIRFTADDVLRRPDEVAQVVRVALGA